MRKPVKPRLAVVDLETDPEDYNGEYLPFVVGFYDGYSFRYFWDRPGMYGSCIADWVAYMQAQERPYLVYAHNGGKFDFMLMLDYLEKELHIQNGRIVRCHVGQHELRDSFSIIAVPLSDFKGKHEKKKFSSRAAQTAYYVEKFNRRDRLKHRSEIIEYLQDDCLTLYDGVARFRDEFGDKLTIGATSMGELKKLHPFESGGGAYDKFFRPFYFGGRNQCFQDGEITGPYKIYDVNSMYPHVMRTCQHPVSVAYDINMRINSRTTFALIEAENYGCLPVRQGCKCGLCIGSQMKGGGLDFGVERGVFHASIHEINAGLETGTLKIIRVKHTIEHKRTTNFATFVDHFYQKRLAAREQGLEMLVTFYKLVMNSAYGKFAQNPENFRNYIITHGEIPDDVCQPHCQPGCPYHWTIDQTDGNFFIWSRPSNSKIYFNVATAASITAAARACLLRGLAVAVDPIYCDTDSIIARKLDVEIDVAQLGAWKQEASGDKVFIAGKKLYAVMQNGECVKQAAKGVIITPAQILEVCKGGAVQTTSAVPHFKFNGSHAYVTRRVVSTAKASHFGR